MPASASASGRLGVTTAASGSSAVLMDSTASAASSVSPLLAIITGSTTRLGTRRSRTAAATRRTRSAVASIPVLAARTAKSAITAWICARTTSADTTSTAETPRVFCAVMAVMAHTP